MKTVKRAIALLVSLVMSAALVVPALEKVVERRGYKQFQPRQRRTDRQRRQCEQQEKKEIQPHIRFQKPG